MGSYPVLAAIACRAALSTGLLSSLIALGLVACGGSSGSSSSSSSSSSAAAYTLLYSFGEAANDGTNPEGGLIQGTDGNLYGTTYSGGTQGSGTVFRISPSSGAETVLYSFGSTTGDGEHPAAGLVQGSDGNLYGTTDYGGTQNYGTVFEISPSTGAETVLYSFGSAAGDGEYPTAALIQDSAGNLYGTTVNGGGSSTCTGGCGTVFEISPSGTETLLYAFSGGDSGAYPSGALVQGSDGNLYGTTSQAGAYSSGAVFMVSPGSAGTETVLYSFSGVDNVDGDGANPEGALILGSDGNLYGTTVAGGGGTLCTTGCGTVFEVSPSSGAETILRSFGNVINDGTNPEAGLIQGTNGNLYGTTYGGGSGGDGVVFAVSPSTDAETVLHAFAGADGKNPAAGLIQGSDGNLYGTTSGGGANNSGAVFEVSLQ